MQIVFDTATRRLEWLANGRLICFVDFDTLSISTITVHYPKYLQYYLVCLEESF